MNKMVILRHSSHLGSASWITNYIGDAVQHLQYLPYGEPYVDKRTSGYSERFRFMGKERDEETGYGYFGARYMDHELMTMWLSVDPMMDKYPSISPYAYCAWNPVKLVDPDGRDVWEVDENGYVNRINEEGKEHTQTVKYANGSVIKFRGENYHKIMLNLSITDANNVSATNGGEEMQFAHANVFKSMADNTNVEWIMQRYSDNHYSLGTKHDNEFSPKTNLLSEGRYNDRDVVARIHSHPMVNQNNPTGTPEQVKSMGYQDDPRYARGDLAIKRTNLRQASYYTYFPRTKQLWSVGLRRPAFIRNVNSASDFFFGTYNTR